MEVVAASPHGFGIIDFDVIVSNLMLRTLVVPTEPSIAGVVVPVPPEMRRRPAATIDECVVAGSGRAPLTAGMGV